MSAGHSSLRTATLTAYCPWNLWTSCRDLGRGRITSKKATYLIDHPSPFFLFSSHAYELTVGCLVLHSCNFHLITCIWILGASPIQYRRKVADRGENITWCKLGSSCSGLAFPSLLLTPCACQEYRDRASEQRQ